MQKCSLCGGKVVNGRCEDCGLPIPPEHRYTLRSETAHTHTFNGEEILHRVRQPRKPSGHPERRMQTARPRSGRADPAGGHSKAQLANVLRAVVTLVVLMNLLPVLLRSCAA